MLTKQFSSHLKFSKLFFQLHKGVIAYSLTVVNIFQTFFSEFQMDQMHSLYIETLATL